MRNRFIQKLRSDCEYGYTGQEYTPYSNERAHNKPTLKDENNDLLDLDSTKAVKYWVNFRELARLTPARTNFLAKSTLLHIAHSERLYGR